jgi:hypothetical protein
VNTDKPPRRGLCRPSRARAPRRYAGRCRPGTRRGTCTSLGRRRAAVTAASPHRRVGFARLCPHSPVLIENSPASAPRAVAIGSSGAGLSTTRSPRSSSASVDVPHRRRMLDGIEICPPRDILTDFTIILTDFMITKTSRDNPRAGGPTRPSRTPTSQVVGRAPGSAQPPLERIQLAVQLVRQAVEFRKVLAELRQLGLPLLGVDPQQLCDILV